MRFILIALLLICCSFSTYSQYLPDSQPDSTTEIVKAEGDTIAAVNNLFKRKRKANKAGLVVFSVLTLSSVVAGASSDQAGNFLIGAVFGAFAINNGVKLNNKYGEKRLEQIINDYQNGKPIPRDVRKKLKEKDFK